MRDAEVALESLYTLALKDQVCAAELFNPTEINKCLQMIELREAKKLVKKAQRVVLRKNRPHFPREVSNLVPNPPKPHATLYLMGKLKYSENM